MRDPHQNIFYYYRGPSKKFQETLHDIQVEDNTTKALINILEFAKRVNFELLLKSFLRLIGISNKQIMSFRLQKREKISRPDGIINFADSKVLIESKVRSVLSLDQVSHHVKSLNPNDLLLVITNNKNDCSRLKELKDDRILYVSWYDIHKDCLGIVNEIAKDNKSAAILAVLEDFINYLEVIVMTEFSGFKDEDFDFWVDPNPNYVPILRKKLEAFANKIKENLPRDIASEYSFIKPGNISRNVRDDRFAWVAIKRPENKRDVFNQCNFTIEVSKGSLDINTVIRNGRTTQPSKPIGIFYDKLTNDPEGFLKIIDNIKIDARLVISRKLPKIGDKIMPGNERWVQFLDMKLKDISNKSDIDYMRKILQKADAKPALPGVHIRYSIDRGEKILAEPDRLQEEIIKTIKIFRPILKYLES